MPITLRPYQQHDLDEVRAAMRQHRRVLLVQPTGAGKGTLASYIVDGASRKGNSVIFLVNRRAIVNDFSKRLDKLGIDHGVIMGDHKRSRPWLTTQVASIDTLRRRGVPKAEIVIVDEARFATSKTWMEVLGAYDKAKHLLMDATPELGSGAGLGLIADYMVRGPSVQSLIDQKYLVPSRVFEGTSADVSGVKKTGGDYNEKALAAVCDQTKLVGDIVTNWQRLASERKTVVFGIDQHHAQGIAEQFRCAGIDWGYVDAETSDEDRDKLWDDFDHGRLRGISSVGVISFGWDHPICDCVVMARPTGRISVHLQQIGRGSRPHPGKTDLMVLDHAGNRKRHGFYEDEHEWSLDGEATKSTGDSAERVVVCQKCWFTFRPGPKACPECGAPIDVTPREIKTVEADLVEAKREKMAAVDKWRVGVSGEKRKLHFEEFVRIAAERGYSSKWPSVKFNAIYKEWPSKAWTADAQKISRNTPKNPEWNRTVDSILG